MAFYFKLFRFIGILGKKTSAILTMKQNYNELPNGYLESINRGIQAVRNFRGGMSRGKLSHEEAIARLKTEIETADAIVIGAGAGLSTAAGFIYSGERFEKYFGDFAKRFGIQDMYSGGFYPFPAAETRWAWWARNIYINRYVPAPKPVYDNLLALVKDKDYFVITTNVDHQFQKAGFDKTAVLLHAGRLRLVPERGSEDLQNLRQRRMGHESDGRSRIKRNKKRRKP